MEKTATAKTVKEIFEELATVHGTDGSIEMIEQFFEDYLDLSDREDKVFNDHWSRYHFTKHLKTLFLQAKIEFDLRH